MISVKIPIMGRHLCDAPLKKQEETSAVFFVPMRNRNLCLTRLIDVEVDNHEKAPTVRRLAGCAVKYNDICSRVEEAIEESDRFLLNQGG